MSRQQVKSLKLVSWNLYHRTGAAIPDIAAMIAQEKPDLFVMQEATADIEQLTQTVGGAFYPAPWKGKRYCLAAWAPKPLGPAPEGFALPFSRLPGKFPPRVAQIIEIAGLRVANVHLSHGQLLNRKQLRCIADGFEGPLAIVGDYNSVGPVKLPGFSDVGPRAATHHAQKVVPLRLDRCMIRDVRCLGAETRERGPSDHKPIVLELESHPVTGA